MSRPDKFALPARVGVYGGGRMGSGIAHAMLAAGCEVFVVEAQQDVARAAAQRIRASLATAERRGALQQSASTVAEGLTTTADPSLLGTCGLVIEAVPEDLALKREVFETVSRLAPQAVLATNTSALSIDVLAAGLARPSQFLGMHFFNPVPASALVEIVVGSATDPSLVAQAQEWVRGLAKTPITVRDSPGFASSRLGVLLSIEAMRMLEAGVASAEDIDAAMTLGYKHPMGPLRTTDVVGLDVRLAIAEHLERELGDRFAPPDILRDLVQAGALGRKSGRGFYSWQ